MSEYYRTAYRQAVLTLEPRVDHECILVRAFEIKKSSLYLFHIISTFEIEFRIYLIASPLVMLLNLEFNSVRLTST